MTTDRSDNRPGGPEDLDRARMLPHLRDRYRLPRPSWVDRRSIQLTAWLARESN